LVRASSKELLGLVLLIFGQGIGEHMCPGKGRGSPNSHKKYMAYHKEKHVEAFKRINIIICICNVFCFHV
jgi:hypothetical protein